jgi:hypothetical protein
LVGPTLINDIQIEVRCKMGRKYFPADVVIDQDHSPFVVIECKKQEEDDQDEGFKQAISYATFLGAKFVVFTNGIKWLTKYYDDSKWIPTIDIPHKINAINKYDNINSLIDLFQAISPLLFWIYRPIPKEQSSKFFSVLLDFFSHETSLFYGVDTDLLHGTTSLLKVTGTQYSRSNQQPFKFGEYEKDKIMGAYNIISRYLTKIGLSPIPLPTMDWQKAEKPGG